MSKFRKKPVEVEARQYDGANAAEIVEWIKSEGGLASFSEWRPTLRSATGVQIEHAHASHIKIHTLEGEMIAHHRDWIIQGVKGEFYPCRQDIFEQTYEPADQETTNG